MLIIAIPKSASTSLMLTLGKYHNLEAKQDLSFSKNKSAENCQILYKLHSDVRELTDNDVKLLSIPSAINKQHIYPSSNNVSLLSNIKKVILLRPPDEIILAYRRGAVNKVHNLLPGYSSKMTENEWLEKSKSDGLYSDLTFFCKEWKEKAKSENTLFIDYQDYVENPNIVLNEIEKFYGLAVTQQKVKTIKARYSRRNAFSSFIFRIKAKVKNTLIAILRKLRLKN